MTLYGVGLGPGDPELLTVRGREILDQATRVYTPGDLAERIAETYVSPEKLERLSFPMTRDETALEAAWTEAAEAVATVARNEVAAFVTIGDPNVYSTFSYLETALQEYPEVTVETVPGVSVLTAFTTAMDVEIDDSAIEVREAASGVPEDGPDQLLLLKVTDVGKVHPALRAAGYEVTYGRRVFMEEPTVTSDPADLDESDYFTVAYATREDNQ